MAAWRLYHFVKIVTHSLQHALQRCKPSVSLRAPWPVAMALCPAAFEAVTKKSLLLVTGKGSRSRYLHSYTNEDAEAGVTLPQVCAKLASGDIPQKDGQASIPWSGEAAGVPKHCIPSARGH